MRAVVLAAAALFTLGLAASAQLLDFHAFYCAGAVANQHANPYYEMPLRRCELGIADAHFAPYVTKTTLPVPLPGYTIAVFAALAHLPFGIAERIWTLALLLCAGAAMLAVTRLAGVSAVTAVCAFLLSLAGASVGLGETVPVCVAAICVCALFAQQRRWTGAALAGAATLFEPHIGLPVVVSLALWAPRTRAPLALSVTALAVLSIATVGLSANVEYLTRVLPVHALSEIGADAQLSLSAILHAFGASPKAALLAGTLSYALACAAGIVLGGVLSKKYGSAAFAVAAPAALAVFGGTFIHVTQMAAAIPLTLLLMTRAPRYRNALIVALVLLAVPWRLMGSPGLIVASMLVAFALTWENSGGNVRFAGLCSVGALLFLAAVGPLAHVPDPLSHAARTTATAIDPRYAQASWAQFNARYLSTGAEIFWWRRLPTWGGLLLLLAASAGASRHESYRLS